MCLFIQLSYRKLIWCSITVSDTCSNGTATDSSGPHLVSLVKSKLNSTADINYVVIPDEIEIIKVSNIQRKYARTLLLSIDLSSNPSSMLLMSFALALSSPPVELDLPLVMLRQKQQKPLSIRKHLNWLWQ